MEENTDSDNEEDFYIQKSQENELLEFQDILSKIDFKLSRDIL